MSVGKSLFRRFRRALPTVRTLVVLSCGPILTSPASAHRLDELLQATFVAVEPEWVRLEIRLTPGVDVARAWFAGIDADRDGTVSPEEGRRYAQGVWNDIELWLDGKPLKLEPVDHAVSPVADLFGGVGHVRIRANAAMDRVTVGEHRIVLVNRHQTLTSVFLVNALASTHPRVVLRSQSRDLQQTTYRLAYTLRDIEAGSGKVGSATVPSEATR